MNIQNVEKAILAAWKIGRTPHIIGLHGIGKSSIVKQICDKHGYEMKDVRLGQMADPGDLIGLPEFHTNPETLVKYLKYVFPDFFPTKPNTVIFLDEINRSSKDILQAVFEMIYDKKLKGVELPPNCHIVAASNPATDDYAVLDFSDAAFQDRFIHIKLSPTVQEFHAFAKAKYPTSGALDFLMDSDYKTLEDGNLASFTLDFVKPSRRSWENGVMPLEVLYNDGEISKDVFAEMVMGIIGMHAAPAYFTYIETNVGSIKADLALTDYAKVRSLLLKTKDKGRTDILGNLVNEIGAEIGKRKGLELKEANNLIEIVRDLTPELAYTLCTLFTAGANHEICANVDGMPGGLLDNDELVEIMMKTNKLREQAAADIEAAKTAAPKKTRKTKETV